jgi:hypothetical protein
MAHTGGHYQSQPRMRLCVAVDRWMPIPDVCSVTDGVHSGAFTISGFVPLGAVWAIPLAQLSIDGAHRATWILLQTHRAGR